MSAALVTAAWIRTSSSSTTDGFTFDCIGFAAGRTRLNVVAPWFSTRRNPHPMKIVADGGSSRGAFDGRGAWTVAGAVAARPGAAVTGGRAGATGGGAAAGRAQAM